MTFGRFASREVMDDDARSTSFQASGEVLELMHERLDYNTNRSAAIRRAIEVYLNLPDDVHERLEAADRDECEIFADALSFYFHNADAGFLQGSSEREAEASSEREGEREVEQAALEAIGQT